MSARVHERSLSKRRGSGRGRKKKKNGGGGARAGAGALLAGPWAGVSRKVVVPKPGHQGGYGYVRSSGYGQGPDGEGGGEEYPGDESNSMAGADVGHQEGMGGGEDVGVNEEGSMRTGRHLAGSGTSRKRGGARKKKTGSRSVSPRAGNRNVTRGRGSSVGSMDSSADRIGGRDPEPNA